MNALEITNLTKVYPGFRLDGIDLTLPGGCILGLIGENGAGKSTTIRLILDMIHKDAGTVKILGRDNQEDLFRTKQEIGVVLDEVGLPQCLNAKQVAKIMRKTYRNWNDKTFDGLLKRLSVPMDKPFKSFSRGMKMKLGLAIALSHDAKLLILDEATSGLDPVVRDEVVEILYDFTRDPSHSILISSHIVSDLEKLCDYISFLHKGKMIVCEEKDILLDTYCVVRGSAQELEVLDPDCIIHKKESAYGVEAVVRREQVPTGMKISPISIEDLFVAMIKEAN